MFSSFLIDDWSPNGCLYYENFALSDQIKEINVEEEHILYAANWMVENKSTIQKTAQKCGYSYGTLWRRIHKELRQLSPELYYAVLYRIELNKRNRIVLLNKKRWEGK